MEGLAPGATVATVNLTSQEIQTITDTSNTLQIEPERESNQVMSVFLENESATDLQHHITSIAEQHGISIIQDSDIYDQNLGIKTDEQSVELQMDPMTVEASEDAGTSDDATSLFAKLQANNTNKSNYVQLTSDGKIIKQQRDQLETTEMVESTAATTLLMSADSLSTSMQGLLQQVTLQDGSTGYIPHPASAGPHQVQLEDGTLVVPVMSGKESVQAVRMEDGSIAYIPTEMLQQTETGITATVNLNLDPDISQSDLQSQISAPEPLIQIEATKELQADLQNQVSSAQQVVFMDAPQTLQISSVTGGANSLKTIREQLAGGSAASMQLGGEEKLYQCSHDRCNKYFSTTHHLKTHERTHTGDKPYVCDHVTCQKAFATAYGLKSHKRTHTGEQPYQCMVCPKAFKTSGDLQKHTRTHTGEKPFECPFEGCNKRFTTSNIRKVHIRVHTGERPYECDLPNCGKKFSSATNYKNHMRIHTGERPYVCAVVGCGKRFTEYSSLYKHHVVHTHTKPYVCQHCGKTYRQTSSLAMHKRTAHNDFTGVTESETIKCDPPPPPPSRESSYQPETDMGEGALVINTGETAATLNTAVVTTSSGSPAYLTNPEVPSPSISPSHITTDPSSKAKSFVLPAGIGGGGSPQVFFVANIGANIGDALVQIASDQGHMLKDSKSADIGTNSNPS